MAPRSPKITLYVDTVSPFAYEAYWLLRNDPVFAQCEITYIPMFLGGVMKATGNTAPINIKNKDVWIGKERIRWAKLFNIPMRENMPDGFPPLTLSIMRSLCALTVLHDGGGGGGGGDGGEGQEKLTRCLDALYHAYWVEHKPTTQKEVLAEILSGVLGAEEAGKVLEMAGNEGKKVLAENTDKALADGAFGLPWFVCVNGKGEKEAFWGVDHIGQVCSFLGLEKPKQGGWKAVL